MNTSCAKSCSGSYPMTHRRLLSFQRPILHDLTGCGFNQRATSIIRRAASRTAQSSSPKNGRLNCLALPGENRSHPDGHFPNPLLQELLQQHTELQVAFGRNTIRTSHPDHPVMPGGSPVRFPTLLACARSASRRTKLRWPFWGFPVLGQTVEFHCKAKHMACLTRMKFFHLQPSSPSACHPPTPLTPTPHANELRITWLCRKLIVKCLATDDRHCLWNHFEIRSL